MKNKGYGWISLLLAGTLCIPGSTNVWADMSNVVAREEGTADFARDSSADKAGDLQREEYGVVSQNEDDAVFSGEDREDVVSKNEVFGGEDGADIGLQKYEQEAEPSVSDNSLSSNEVSEDNLTVLEDWSANEEIKKRPLNVILPTEIPFSIILLGKTGLKGMIDSKQFCIENRGYEDVCIIIKGVCLGENEEDYIVSDTSVRSGGVQGKKNIWMYLEWEDENGEKVDCPKTIIGNLSNPGVGEIVLKAPERNKKGNIKGDNSESKAYFSIKGDLYSDMSEPWKSNELKLDLGLSMKTISVTDRTDVINEAASGVKSLIQEDDWDRVENISDNTVVSENQEKVSDNEDVSDMEKTLIETLGREDSWMSANSTNMPSSTLVEVEDFEDDERFGEVD